MKFFAASRSRVNREGSFRPQVVTLESRLQPGSILTSGMGAASVGAALVDVENLDNTANLSLVSHQRTLGDESVPADKMHVTLSQTPTAAPRSTEQHATSTPTLTRTTGIDQLPLSSQLRAVSSVAARAVTPTHAAASATQAPVAAPHSGVVHTQQTATQTANPRALSATPATTSPAAVSALVRGTVQLAGSGDIRVVASSSSHHGGLQSADIYVSYAPQPASVGPTEGNAVGLTTDGISIATGFTLNPNSGLKDVYFESSDSNGNVVDLILESSAGNNLVANAIKVIGDSVTGQLFAVGTSTDPNGVNPNGLFILNVTNDLNPANLNSAGLVGTNGNISGNGITCDSAGNVLIVGQAADSSGGNDLTLVQLDAGLTTILNGVSLQFIAGDSIGKAVGVDGSGNFIIGGQLTNSANGDKLALFLAIGSDFASLPWNGGFTWNQAAGPDNVGGSVNGIKIDPSGSSFFQTGTLSGTYPAAGADKTDEILANNNTADGSIIFAWNWGFHNPTPGQPDLGDLGGTAIDLDSLGNIYTSVNQSDTNGTYDGGVLAFLPGGASLGGTLDYGDQGPLTTPFEDRSTGVVVAGVDLTWATGWTSSDETNAQFNLTPNAARGNINSAGHDGYIAQGQP